MAILGADLPGLNIQTIPLGWFDFNPDWSQAPYVIGVWPLFDGTTREVAKGMAPGTNNESVPWAAKLRGQEAVFAPTTDGVANYLDFGLPPQIPSSTTMTIMARIHRPTASTRAVGWGICGGAAAHTMMGQWYLDDKLYIVFSVGAGAVNGSVALGGAGWHDVVLDFDGTQSTDATKARIWVDGVEQTLTFVGAMPTALSATMRNVSIGRQGAATFWGPGSVIDMRLLKRPGPMLASDVLAYSSPQTMWNAYRQPSEKTYFSFTPPVGGTWPGAFINAGYY